MHDLDDTEAGGLAVNCFIFFWILFIYVENYAGNWLVLHFKVQALLGGLVV